MQNRKQLLNKLSLIGLFVLFLLVCLENSYSQEAKMYLKKDRNRYYLVVESDIPKIEYTVFGSPGKIYIVLKNWVIGKPRRISFKEYPIKQLYLSTKKGESIIETTLEDNFIMRCNENEKTLVCQLDKAKSEDIVALKLNEYIYEKDCDKFIMDYKTNRNLLYKQLHKEELSSYEKFLLECADKNKDYELFLEASNYIQSLGFPLDDKTKIKKIHLLHKLKRYNDVITEGNILLGELKKKPEEYEVATLVMDSLLAIGQTQRAFSMLKNYSLINVPERYRADLTKVYGKFYYQNDFYFASYMYLKKALEMDPSVIKYDNIALFQLGVSAYKLKKFDEAIKYLLLAVNLHPDMRNEAGEALYIIGTIHKDRREKDKALWIFNQTALLYPNTKGGALAKLNIAIAEKEKNPSEAIRLLRSILNLYNYPDVRELALINLAECCELVKDEKEALALYRQFVNEFPKSSFYQKALDRLKNLELGEIEKAYKEKKLEEAVVRASNFIKTYKDDPLIKEAYRIAKKAINDILEKSIAEKNCFMATKIWKEYKEMIDIDVKNGEYAFEIAKCLYLNNASEAINIMEYIVEKFFKQFTKKSEVLNLLTDYYISNNTYSKLENIIKNFNNHIDPIILNKGVKKLSEFYFISKNIKELESTKKINNIYQQTLGYIDYLSVVLYLENKEIEKAINLLEGKRIMKFYPHQDEKLRMIIARELLERKNYKNGLKMLEKIVNIYTKGKYRDEALFLLGYYSTSKKQKNLWWSILESEYKNSYWYKELQSIKLAEETIKWAQKAILNR
ncbi:MAG: tetratricopeptide repeat protein [Thermosulfidibacteraceae bacterium]